jgi:hypothetical protein
MIRKLFVPLALFTVLLVLGSAWTVMADDWDQKTAFTINQPVSIPGHVVLPAGSYVIKRLEATTPVVQILNSTETHVFATLMPVPDFVQQPSEKSTFTFQEMPEGSPAILRTWHYPGSQVGYEFVNPNTD